jgi:hypothetical protein
MEFFVAPRSQKFAVVGDRGLHERCGDSRATAARRTSAKPDPIQESRLAQRAHRAINLIQKLTAQERSHSFALGHKGGMQITEMKARL